MTEFKLQIVTPDKTVFDGMAEFIKVKTVNGEIGVLARHIPYATPLAIGEAQITINGEVRSASCAGGLLSVMPDVTRIVARTFEWADEIDIERAERAKEKAEKIIQDPQSEHELKMAEVKFRRALVRLDVASESK